MTKLYGIKNCDTVKKARKWLETAGVAYEFHDFRDQGLDASLIQNWLTQIDAATLINKRSTTWKQLSDADKTKVEAGDFIAIAVANPTLIKRPVLDHNNAITVGFKDKQYADLLA
ncbi:Spx/MgsR family transcriptional regulator [Alteromonadaceae bacterium 2753L.S.0a.02]|nr:Spx/MgsR family transcriptional regulator [Alteromonadaceae bacterium 2753L.S.0a.02]